MGLSVTRNVFLVPYLTTRPVEERKAIHGRNRRAKDLRLSRFVVMSEIIELN
jgi:hypothetical protein